MSVWQASKTLQGIKSKRCVLIWSLLLLAGCTPGASFPAPLQGTSAPPQLRESLGDGETLAFLYMDLWTSPQLYLLDDADGVRILDQDHKCTVGAAWSPNGKQIVYTPACQGPSTYYLVAADGSNPRQLMPEVAYRSTPRWSPDGTRLAYLANGQSDEPIRVHVTEVTSGETHRLAPDRVEDFAWLSDSQSLLVAQRKDGSVTMEVYGVDGTSERIVGEAASLRDAARISLSPDASQVAYILPVDEDDESLNDLLYVATLDGSDAHLVGSLWLDGAAVWSPDSKRIAFVALNDDAFSTLYVVTADGTGLRELMVLDTGDESGEILPAAAAWSADSTRIAISSYLGDGSAIFVIDAHSGERRQLTAASGLIYDLAWRPGE